jgi:hypothetical protein
MSSPVRAISLNVSLNSATVTHTVCVVLVKEKNSKGDFTLQMASRHQNEMMVFG